MFVYLQPRLQFVFNKSSGLSLVEVEALDVFFNRNTSKMQLVQGDVSWRRVCEKDPDSLQKNLLKHNLTELGNVILDAYGSTCNKIIYFFLNFWNVIVLHMTNMR